MYNIIPFILILLSIGIIVFIIIRKFPALANVDVDNIPQEKEKRFKEKIISNRLKRSIVKWSSKLTRFFRPAGQGAGNFFKWLLVKLNEIRESYKSEPVLKEKDINEAVKEIMREAEDLAIKEDFEAAEKKLIEAINLDNKNIEVFKKLGSLYFKRKSFNEAKETLKYVLKLTGGEDSEVYFDLSLAYKEMGDLSQAIININNALKIEPNNPRYLDTLFEISIMNKDKVLALKAFKKLKEVNPENQKLADLKGEIDEL